MVHDRPVAEMDPVALYRVLELRAAVFVVEQACVFLDPDGHDLEPGCRQLWIEDDAGDVLACARVLDEGDARRIGRIVTAASARGGGLASRLLEHVLDRYEGPWVLDGQVHLADFYRRFGFEISGEAFVEDGIPHVPMRRDV